MPIADADGRRTSNALDVIGVAEAAEQFVGALVVVQHLRRVLKAEKCACSPQRSFGIGNEIFVVDLVIPLWAESRSDTMRAHDLASPRARGLREMRCAEAHRDHRRRNVPAVSHDVEELRVWITVREHVEFDEIAGGLIRVPGLAVGLRVRRVESGDCVRRSADPRIVAEGFEALDSELPVGEILVGGKLAEVSDRKSVV